MDRVPYIGRQASAREFLKQNLDTARAFVGDRVSVQEAPLGSVGRGEGSRYAPDGRGAA